MKWGKTIVVICGAVIITALGIDAADTLTGSDGTLLSQVMRTNSKDSVCPNGMSHVQNIPTVTCIDTFEVSAGKDCPVRNPDSVFASIQNTENSSCHPVSIEGELPWRFVTRDQAMQACARVGKRLPTSEEWYQLSLGMSGVESVCNVSSGTLSKTGENTSCVSPHGAFDFVGNVWEWVSDDIIDGVYGERKLPNEGYVAQTDSAGMATVSSDQPQPLFGSDYFWTQESGAYGIIRGGYFDSGTDAGIYTVHADTVPTTASAGIGFRCVQ